LVKNILKTNKQTTTITTNVAIKCLWNFTTIENNGKQVEELKR